MPGCTVYSEENQQLLVKFHGELTLREMEEQAAQLAANPTMGVAKRKYISFYAVSHLDQDISQDKVRAVAQSFLRAFVPGPGKRTALVAPTSESFGIVREFQEVFLAADEPGEVRIFTSKEEAFAWLGGSHHQWTIMRERISRMC